MFRQWLSAAAASVGFFSGLTYWHELPTRQAAFIRKASVANQAPTAEDQQSFAPAFQAAAD